MVLASTLDDLRYVPSRYPPSSRVPEASGAGGELKAFFQTGAHAPGVCHHCCRRIPRDHARKRAQGTTVLTAFDNPIPLSLQYVKGAGGASYFPVSAITDRLYARNQLYRYRSLRYSPPSQRSALSTRRKLSPWSTVHSFQVPATTTRPLPNLFATSSGAAPVPV